MNVYFQEVEEMKDKMIAREREGSAKSFLIWMIFKHSYCLVAQLVKESACKAGDLGLIPGLGRSPGEGNGYPLQYSGLENSKDCIDHGVTKSQTQLSEFHFTSPHRPERS